MIQWGQYKHPNYTQWLTTNLTLPTAYSNNDYNCFIMGNAHDNNTDGRGIVTCSNKTYTDFNAMICGPWQDWVIQYFNWITIGF